MSDVVVHHIGGGDSAYAFVIANYPAGSTVTCTNSSGKKDLSATQTLFYIKKGITSCVVTATLSGKSATKTVTGITEGSSSTVTLSYEYVVFADGQINSDMGALKLSYDKVGGSTWKIVGGNLTLISADGSGQRGVAYGGFTNPVAVNAERRYLCFTVVQGSGNNSEVGASTNNGEGFSAYASTGDVSEANPKSICIDLAAYYGNCYIKAYSWGATIVKVSRIWLQSEGLT